jgi:hypothetical protein
VCCDDCSGTADNEWSLDRPSPCAAHTGVENHAGTESIRNPHCPSRPPVEAAGHHGGAADQQRRGKQQQLSLFRYENSRELKRCRQGRSGQAVGGTRDGNDDPCAVTAREEPSHTVTLPRDAQRFCSFSMNGPPSRMGGSRMPCFVRGFVFATRRHSAGVIPSRVTKLKTWTQPHFVEVLHRRARRASARDQG